MSLLSGRRQQDFVPLPHLSPVTLPKWKGSEVLLSHCHPSMNTNSLRQSLWFPSSSHLSHLQLHFAIRREKCKASNAQPLAWFGLAWLYQARSQSYQQTLTGPCLSKGPREWKCCWSLSAWHFSLFLPQNQCERSFSAPLWVKGVGDGGEGGRVGKGWKNTQQMRNFSHHFSSLQFLYIGLIRTLKAPQDYAVRFVSLAP